ncbi:hypothetical protein DICPUDRAFT_54176 [Dictyostelium purpureum]|uniref:ABC transporter domain-containing protein n=1 Tax=Dictyostelium purpureum TaxID=5786 RepID=F0ZFV9_DICPU|nr:uncharacterized protein DICPUDRAFT_54176 [Dictyostelium purpureum]EGC37181.1 hypothetical protein DICPUDRAFT_54176 [Dictyostelium purpureum]|eukprot:XP_003286309.1 hypothetical protein DICPUDRAFT_54176 [Dictyostelium purpureum]
MESLSGNSEEPEYFRASNNNNNNTNNNNNNEDNIEENNYHNNENDNNTNDDNNNENGIVMNTIDISNNNNNSSLDNNTNQFNNNDNSNKKLNKSTLKNKVDFSFKDINHYVTTVTKTEKGRKKISKQILTNINGHVKSGEMISIMGPSGAGKTTLLDILAHRLPINGSGTIYLNGNKSNFQIFKKLCGYVTQHDSLTPSMTVRETLNFYAQLKMPRSTTMEEKLQRVQDVITEMGLKRCSETLVGTADSKIRGISGGERRRVTIAIELLTGPSILFLDEPTSGLDASTAYSVMRAIRKLAKSGRSVICTIHQPRSNIYDMFDRLLLLGEGNVIYCGDTTKAVDYFSRYGYQCGDLTNPADFFMDLINLQVEDQIDSDDEDEYDEEENLEIATPSSSTSPVLSGVPKAKIRKNKKLTTEEIGVLKKEYPQSDEGVMIAQTLDTISKENRNDFKYEKIEGPTFFTQFRLLLYREVLNARRHPLAFKVQLFQAMFQGLLCGVVYYQLGVGQSSVQSRTGVLAFVVMGISFPFTMTTIHVFPDVITIFLKDRASGVYNTLPFFLAKSFIDMCNAICLPVITGTIVYWMCNERVYPFYAAAPFFRFLLVLVMNAQTALSLGVLISSSVPNVQVGTAVAPLVVILFFLFSGFFINLNDVPGWLVWFPYISFFKYIIESAVINGFENVEFTCTESQKIGGQCPNQYGNEIIKNMGYDVDHFWRNIWILAIYIIGFRTITFLVLRLKSRDKFTQNNK